MRPVAVRPVARLFTQTQRDVSVLVGGEAHRRDAGCLGPVRAVAEGLSTEYNTFFKKKKKREAILKLTYKYMNTL